METLVDFLESELARRSWRQADLARAAGVPDATIHHVLNGSRRAGPEVCNALARALDLPPERVFRLAGLLPPLPPAVEEEQEAVRILRRLPPDLREAAMRMLRGLRPGRGVHVHIAGIDLIQDPAGEFRVLEDNLRTPSGVSYVLENRMVMKKVFPRVFAQARVQPVEASPPSCARRSWPARRRRATIR